MNGIAEEHALCALKDIADPGTKGFEVALDGQQVLRLFVVRKAGALAAYRNSCLHTGAPLEWLPHQFFDLEQSFIHAPSTARCFGRRTATVCAVLRWQIARTCRTGGQERLAVPGGDATGRAAPTTGR